MKKMITQIVAIILVTTSFISCTRGKNDVIETANSTVIISNNTISDISLNPNETAPIIQTKPLTITENLSQLYDTAMTNYLILDLSTLDADYNEIIYKNDNEYYKVNNYNSLAELNEHLLTIFSPEVIEQITALNTLYIEENDSLYVTKNDRSSDVSKGIELSREITMLEENVYGITIEIQTRNPQTLIPTGSVFFEFVCEMIDNQWIFTTFPAIR